MHDGARAHIAQVVIDAASDAGLEIDLQPPYSPEFQPMELVWAWMAKVVYQGNPAFKTREEQTAKIEEVWQLLNEDQELRYSLVKRVREVILATARKYHI